MNNNEKNINVHRESNIELYRIIVMFAIVSAHYVLNSGLLNCISESNPFAANSFFLLLFGCWGKIGINCFLLITGYYMCKSDITLKKFLKLILEMAFYKYTILLLFIITGYQELTFTGLMKSILPFHTLTNGFAPCYIIFYLFIPFLNRLIRNMDEHDHRLLLILVLGIFSVWASLPFTEVGNSYVFWFMTMYLVGSYIRLYPVPLFSNTAFWGYMSLAAVICAYLSVAVSLRLGLGNYYFLADSYKITALCAAVCFFMFFKNIKIPYKPWINRIAASAFGVLCIHASSNEMRKWLWVDTLKNVEFFNSPYLILHAFISVILVYSVCTVIDQLRIRFIEKPFFRYYDKHIALKIRNIARKTSQDTE